MWDQYWMRFTKQTDDGKRMGDGVGFENLVEKLLSAKYGTKWTRTKKSHDFNRDFWLLLKDERIWAECKNYQSSISMDVLAPTLVMAQVYDVNSILFFSRSSINQSAKNKILAFGEKAKKQINFYDAENLEQLIWAFQDRLPKKYRPPTGCQLFDPAEIPVDLYFSQEAITGALETEEQFVRYKFAERVRYNEVFGLSFYFSNPFANSPLKVRLEFVEESPDRFCFEYLSKNVATDKLVWFEKQLQDGEGCAVTLNMRPVIFRTFLELPRFVLKAYTAAGEVFSWNSEAVSLKCEWISQTKLIGRHYETILVKAEQQLIRNSRQSALVLVGGSGTGKTRMLNECSVVFLKYGYSVLHLTAAENFSSAYFFKEIVTFLYEIPSAQVLELLERRVFENVSEEPMDGMTDARTALKILEMVNRLETEDELFQFVDDFGALLFEKLASQMCALVIDNVQFAEKAFQHFLREFIRYSVNRNRPTYSAVLIVFNQDYMTASSSELLFDILQANVPHMLAPKLSGFEEKNVGILFLRELVHVSDDRFDALFEAIIDRISLNPYHLYQTVKYLEENNAVAVTPDKQGYILQNDHVWRLLSDLSDGVNDVLKRRWEFTSKTIPEENLFKICSVLFLFEKIDKFHRVCFDIDPSELILLQKRKFLRESSPDIYVFDHDIIRAFFAKNFKDQRLYGLRWLQQHGDTNMLLGNRQVYDLCQISVVQDDTYTYGLLKTLDEYFLPPRLAPIFYHELFDRCLEICSYFQDKIQWIDRLHYICKQVRYIEGSMSALDLYERGRSGIWSKLGKRAYTECSPAYRPFLHFYCDILVELHRKDDAETLINSVLEECKHIQVTDQLRSDEIAVLRAIMYNRWYVAYNNADPTPDIQRKRAELMKKSREIIPQIQTKLLRNLIKYLNNSDEGYNYYGYLRDKEKLLSIWDRCLDGMPDAAPEKTLNYHRKKLQYDLILQNFDEAIQDIDAARIYLKHGTYSHEPLIFNTFFLMAEIMAYLQKQPEQFSVYVDRLLTELAQIQQLLENGKMGDILLLRGINAFYAKDVEGVYFSFRGAYQEYSEKKTSRHWIKKKLLFENVCYSFTVLGIYSQPYDLQFLPETYRRPLSQEMLDAYQASGIQRTGDLLMNLPLI